MTEKRFSSVLPVLPVVENFRIHAQKKSFILIVELNQSSRTLLKSLLTMKLN